MCNTSQEEFKRELILKILDQHHQYITKATEMFYAVSRHSTHVIPPSVNEYTHTVMDKLVALVKEL